MSIQNDNVIQALNKSFTDDSSIAYKNIREEFDARIQTYVIDQKWIRRPLILSPPVCARYGWKCINSNLLECVTCGVKLCPGNAKIEKYETYKRCTEKVLQDLKEMHKKHCPWPLAPCPESFVRMIPMHKEEALIQFSDRLKSLLSIEHSLPLIENFSQQNLEMNDQLISSLFKAADISPTDSNLINRCATLLALTGWIPESVSCKSKRHLICRDCHRSVALLSFKNINCASNGSTNDIPDCNESFKSDCISSTDEDPPKKKHRSNLEKELFNPLYEHRPWCLWIAAKTNKEFIDDAQDLNLKKEENNLNCKQGWEIFSKCLLQNIFNTNSKFHTISSPSKEDLQSVRDMIEKWTELSSL